MTNKKNIASKLVLALFILTLISCCLLGSTFARYASGGKGSATISVAEWDVGITDSSSSTFTAVDLSPSKNVWQSGQSRSHPTGKIHVATIENGGEVNALVKVEAGELVATLAESKSWGSGFTATTGGYSGTGASHEQTVGLFSIAFFTDDTAEFSDGAALSADGYDLAVGDTVYIFAEVTWTSDDQCTDANATYADVLDTWVGMNVASVGCTLTYSAVQNSTRPTT